jgi:hypothetical protein
LEQAPKDDDKQHINVTFSHILIRMFDEIIKKMILVFHPNQKTFLYPQKLKLQA